MTAQQWTVLACAVTALGLGLVLALAGRQRVGVARARSRLVLAWLVVALCPVFLIFLFFPDSTISGKFPWGEAGGAIAAFLIVWGIGIKYALQADDLERREAELNKAEISLRSAIAGTNARSGNPLRGGDVELYQLAHRPRRSIGLVPGGIDQVTFADVWVSSENTNMQMARYFDRSVSGVVRYLGARHDDAKEVVQDLIGIALADKLGNRRSVPVGTVFDTEAGQLAGTHNVKGLLHVAAVTGEFGRGYEPAGDVGGCVRKALQRAEELAARTGDIRSVLVPLLGTGTAGGALAEIVPAVLDAAVDHLDGNPNARITTVYISAFTEAERAQCQLALRHDARLQAARLIKRGRLKATQVKST